MNINQMQLEDFFEIKQSLQQFWHERHQYFEPYHRPILFYEFGDTAYVIKEKGEVVAYLFGLLSQTIKTAYVHLIAVKSDCQKHGYGRSLYDHFIAFAKIRGYTKVKAITSPKNIVSVKFHQKIGMMLLGDVNPEGIPVVKDYAGPGEDRVVFEKEI